MPEQFAPGFRALVTGGGAGIGLAVTRKLLEGGARVAVIDLNTDAHGAEDESRLILESGSVASEHVVTHAVDRMVALWGGVDALINAAGVIGRIAPIVDTEVADVTDTLQVNLMGPLLTMKHTLPIMIEQGTGAIVNLSSTNGLDGSANAAGYVLSKHALTGLTKVAALEAAPHGVRVNSVHPGPVSTEMITRLEASRSPADPLAARERNLEAIPLRRYSTPEEVADLVIFLASPLSSGITGGQYRIDGGMGARQ